jgi:hypothetical protein
MNCVLWETETVCGGGWNLKDRPTSNELVHFFNVFISMVCLFIYYMNNCEKKYMKKYFETHIFLNCENQFF